MLGPSVATSPMHDTARLAIAESIVRTARRIAVLGLSPNPDRASYEVAAYLQAAGYDIIPVRPDGHTILGQPVVRDLRTASASGPIDIVNVFRRREYLPEHLPDLLAAHPRLVWMQRGISDDTVAAALENAGIAVVQDRCLMVEHQHWGF